MSNKTVYCIIFSVRMLVSVVSMTVPLIVNAKCEFDEKIRHESWQRQEKCWNIHTFTKNGGLTTWNGNFFAPRITNQHFDFAYFHFISFLTWNTKTYGSNAEKPFPNNNNNAFMCTFSFHNKVKEISNAKSDEAVVKRRKKIGV